MFDSLIKIHDEITKTQPDCLINVKFQYPVHDQFLDTSITLNDIGYDSLTITYGYDYQLDTSNITIDLSDNSKNYTYNNQELTFIKLNDLNYSYTITYTAFDSHDNSSNKSRTINIISTETKIILTPKIIITNRKAPIPAFSLK